MDKINAKFKSKEMVNFPVKTRIKTNHVFAELKAIRDISSIVRVEGEWYHIEGEQKETVAPINFTAQISDVLQLEQVLPAPTGSNWLEVINERLSQIFPMQLDKEHAEDVEANFGLTSSDIMLAKL